MRGSWLTRVAKLLLLLALLVGMQSLALPTRAVLNMDFSQANPMLVANDCTGCDMMGMTTGVCHMICTPMSAIEASIISSVAKPASRFSFSNDIVAYGRAVRPSLAPPRIS